MTTANAMLKVDHRASARNQLQCIKRTKRYAVLHALSNVIVLWLCAATYLSSTKWGGESEAGKRDLPCSPIFIAPRRRILHEGKYKGVVSETVVVVVAKQALVAESTHYSISTKTKSQND